MTQYADADELLAMYTFDNDELKDLNERGHVPLPVIRENIKDCIVPDVEDRLLDACFFEFCDAVANTPAGCEICPYRDCEDGKCRNAYKKDKLDELKGENE